MNSALSKKYLGIALMITAISLAACNSKNNAGGISTPEAFVNKLVELSKNGTISSTYQSSELAKAQSNQPNYFVIWDSADHKYMAINLNTYNQGTLTEAVQYFAQVDAQNPANAGVIVTPDGTNAQGNPLYISSNGTIYSADSQTHDVSLQLSQAKRMEVAKTAALISRNFQMDFNSSVQVTLLGEQIKQISQSRAITDSDRAAITNHLSQISGVTSDQLNQAISESMKGNDKLSNALVLQVSRNLGMPSDSNLRAILAKMGTSVN